VLRYNLRTLMIVAGVVPPTLGFLWFHWRLALMVGLFILCLWLWVTVSLAVARFCGWLVASVMD